MAKKEIEKEAFFKELDSFQIHMPGGKTVDFCETEVLMEMVRKQYPRWKQMGCVTSVPTARVPKLFLHNQQMTKEVKNKLKLTQKGDGAEKNLFKLFVESSFDNQAGIVIFPNVDGSHMFKEQVAKFEIDMVLVHQSKGIFVFNVKNEGSKGTSWMKIEKDMENHNNLIRMLMMYKSPAEDPKIPIHTVVCNFSEASERFMNLEQKSQNQADKTLVFNKTSLKPEVFSRHWIDKIEQAGIENVVWDSRLETLVARLIALNSAEGALALIHNQMTRGLLQTVSKQEHLKAQIPAACQNEEQLKEFKETVVKHSQTPGRKGKVKFILWTKDQLNIISKVYRHLTDQSSGKGLRLLVTGCKGSGKTMLLTFIANLSQSLLVAHSEGDCKGKTLVCDGSFSSPVLITLLQFAFLSTDISLYSAPVTGTDFLSLKAFDEESFTNLHQEFSTQLQNAKILLCDEFRHANHEYLLGGLRNDQHCVLFASAKDYKIGSDFVVIHLGASLRSTCKIAKFADDWIKAKHLSTFEFECRPAHNFEGEDIDVTFVEEKRNDETENKIQFVENCVNVISEHAQKSAGLEIIPVVPLIDSEIRKLIIKKLEEKNYTCYTPSFKMSNDDAAQNAVPRQDAAKITSADLPSISFFSEADIEGSEFGTVIILLRLKDPSHIPTGMGKYFFTAITRASIKVVIVLTDTASIRDFNRSNSEDKIREQFQKAINIVREKRESQPSVIIVGNIPAVPGFRKQIGKRSLQIPQIDGISLYVGEQSCFLHINDVYKESDLKKLRDCGVRLIILFNQCTTCPWQFLFYYSSSKCLELFKEKNRNSFNFYNLSCLDENLINELLCVVRFCSETCGKIIEGLPEAAISRPLGYYNAPTPKSVVFSWDKWKAKAAEHYHLGQKIFAADKYVESIALLERQYYSRISQQEVNVHGAIQDRIDLAKLCTNVALMYMKHYEDPSDEQMEIFDRFRTQEDLGSTFENCMMTAFRHAMRAIEWNASWKRSFERITEMIVKMKEHYTEKESSLQNVSDTELKEIVKQEKSKEVDLSFAKFRKEVSFPLPPFHQAKQDQLDQVIKLYEAEVRSKPFDQLLALRKQISEMCKMLAQESSLLIQKRTVDGKINFVALVQIGCEARQLFEYPIQLSMEALYWNPLEKDCYGILYQALDRLEKVVKFLARSATSLGQDAYLKQITQYEVESCEDN